MSKPQLSKVVRFTHDFVDEEKLSKVPDDVEALLMDQAVLFHKNERFDMVNELQNTLVRVAPTLKFLNLSKSNVTGRVFYKGKEFPCTNPAKEHVSIESYSPTGQPVVRDDDPPKILREGDSEYHYIETVHRNGGFFRFYVESDWLHALEINMRGTSISGRGLTALCTAGQNHLQQLDISYCDKIGDHGIHVIATRCKKLKLLNLSGCSGVSPQGILFLAQMPEQQVQQLQLLHLLDTPHIPFRVIKALDAALEDKGFRGRIRCVDHSIVGQGRRISEVFKNLSGRSIRDLSFVDITEESLTDLAGSIEKNLPCQYGLNFASKLVNDEVLHRTLSFWGEKLYKLDLSETFISVKGLAFLERCMNLRELRLARCWGLSDKQEANRAIMPAINSMLELRLLDISDTLLSGRMFSEHPNLRLHTLIASRNPISVHAVRVLAELCSDTMQHLELAGCNFLNSKAMHYLLRFQKLRVLNLANCSGLAMEDVEMLTEFPPNALEDFEELNISGIARGTAERARKLAGQLTHKKRAVWGGSDEIAPVHVVFTAEEGEQPSAATGASAYLPVSVAAEDGKRKSVYVAKSSSGPAPAYGTFYGAFDPSAVDRMEKKSNGDEVKPRKKASSTRPPAANGYRGMSSEDISMPDHVRTVSEPVHNHNAVCGVSNLAGDLTAYMRLGDGHFDGIDKLKKEPLKRSVTSAENAATAPPTFFGNYTAMTTVDMDLSPKEKEKQRNPSGSNANGRAHSSSGSSASTRSPSSQRPPSGHDPLSSYLGMMTDDLDLDSSCKDKGSDVVGPGVDEDDDDMPC